MRDSLPLPGALPPAPTPLVGRTRELAHLTALLAAPGRRLLTLLGPGGIGKTRLALAVAGVGAPLFHDGVVFVALAALQDPTRVISAIAQALTVGEASDQPLLDRIQEVLAAQTRLLILDNFEQVRAAAPAVAALLAGCPGLTILVTSRAALHLAEEHTYVVPPLPLPLPEAVPLAAVTTSEAGQLFVLRAQVARPTFTLTTENAPAIAAICRCVEGLPLALELAAARIKLLAPEVLLARLDRRLPLLKDAPGDRPARQQTLRGAIAWSYDLLSPAAQRLFRHLAVFQGGGTLDAIETAVAAADGSELGDLLNDLEQLIDNSLLYQADAAAGPSRFIMLETIREFALEQLTAHNEVATLRARHAATYLALAEAAAPHLRGADQIRWIALLEADHSNLRAALRWAEEQAEVLLRLRLVGALWRFWFVRGYWQEAQQELGAALARMAGAPAPADPAMQAARAAALLGHGRLAWTHHATAEAAAAWDESLTLYQALDNQAGIAAALIYLGNVATQWGDQEARRALRVRALAVARSAGDQWNIVDALLGLGTLAIDHGDYLAGRRYYEESLALARTIGYEWAIDLLLLNLGEMASDVGDYATAWTIYSESLARYRAQGHKSGIASALNRAGSMARLRADLDTARPMLDESLHLYRELGYQEGIASTLLNLGLVAAATGDAQAGILLRESLDVRVALNQRNGIAYSLDAFAVLAAQQAQFERAAQLWAAATELWTSIGLILAPAYQAGREQAQAAARARLPKPIWTAAWSRGVALPLDQAIALARQDDPLPVPPRSPYPAGLTRREVAVLRLLAAGLTNPEIAAQLHLSINTVETHLRSIYGKIAVTTRSAATRYALDHHLV